MASLMVTKMISKLRTARKAGTNAHPRAAGFRESFMQVIASASEPESISGLSMSQATDLLDWLENMGFEVCGIDYQDPAGVAVSYRPSRVPAPSKAGEIASHVTATQVDDDAALVQLTEKRFTSRNAAALENELCEVIDSRKHKVILDFSAVALISSAPIAVLFKVRNLAAAHHADMTLINLAPNVLRLFTTLHLERMFNIPQAAGRA